MSKEKNNDDFWLDWWVKHRDRAISYKWYAIGRIDLLVISISAGGIYVVLEILKFIEENQKQAHDTTLIKFSGIMFIAAVVSNFISQLFGKQASIEEAKWAKQQILKEKKDKQFSSEKLNKADCYSDIYDKIVKIVNYISIGLMATGLIIVAYFIYTVL